MSTFGERVKALRQDHNMTQEELANKLLITKQALSHYENGRREPKQEMLENIADIFNVDVDFLLGRSSITSRFLSSEEMRIVDAYRIAGEETKNAICAVLHINRDNYK